MISKLHRITTLVMADLTAAISGLQPVGIVLRARGTAQGG